MTNARVMSTKAHKTEANPESIEPFVFLQIKRLYSYFISEHLSVKFLCIYIFMEFYRPQAIYPVIDVLPWAQLFLLLALGASVLDPKSKFRFSATHGLLLLWVAVIYLSFLVAYYPSWSVEYQIHFVQWPIIFLVFANIVTSRARFYLAFLAFFVCALKIALGTSVQWVARGFAFTSWGLSGPRGYFQNSGELAVLMLMLFPIAYYLFVMYKDKVRRWEYYLLLAATISPCLTILGASSRGAQLALVVVLCIMFWKKIFKPKYILVLSLVVWVSYSILPEAQKERFQNIGEDGTSLQRLAYWENGVEMIQEHPILGVGYYNFIPYFNTHYPEDIRRRSAELPHNIFIQVGTDAGILGLFSFFLLIMHAFLLKPVRKVTKTREASTADEFDSNITKSLKFGILGFLIAGQFVTITYYPFFWICLTFLYCINNYTKYPLANE